MILGASQSLRKGYKPTPCKQSGVPIAPWPSGQGQVWKHDLVIEIQGTS